MASVGDLYGIALLTELLKVSGTDVNPFAWTFSGIQIEPAFEKGETPFPILVRCNLLFVRVKLIFRSRTTRSFPQVRRGAPPPSHLTAPRS